MPFTGDLEQLHIVDIIQLLNTTRKSGTLSVSGEKGESRIIFSNGYIVGATHLNKVRIGSVLVRMKAITQQDLAEALALQKTAGKERKPLLTTLIERGRLKREDAAKGLKKLIEMTLIELVGWQTGTFTLDTDVIAVSPECNYPLSKMEQEVTLDAQMILMDALRIYDERERDRNTGNAAIPDEELFADVVASEEKNPADAGKSLGITADDLGLGDIERLEAKIPGRAPETLTFDTLQIHRQKVRELLPELSADDRETLAAFLDSSSGSAAQDGRTRSDGSGAVILFSDNELLRHSIMTICKEDGVLVFAVSREEEVIRIAAQCLGVKLPVVLLIDYAEGENLQEKIIALRAQIKDGFQGISILQIASPTDYAFVFRAFSDGVKAVFPKTPAQDKGPVFIQNTISLLETIKSYVTRLFQEQKKIAAFAAVPATLNERCLALRNMGEPPAIILSLLQYAAETCGRAITLVVRRGELIGERGIGVYAGMEAGPAVLTGLNISLAKPSVLRDVVETGQTFYGESGDETLKRYLHEMIGAPLSPVVLLIPLRNRDKTAAVIYADFGGNEARPVQVETLEVLASYAGVAVENALYRKQLGRVAVK